MSKITTHVLDVAQGCPARGVPVFLEFEASVFAWKMIGKGVTDEDGRLKDLLPSDYPLQPGNYRIRFNTGAYFSMHNTQGFYPEISVIFTIREASQHYHVPLLLSPFGYSTYRGS